MSLDRAISRRGCDKLISTGVPGFVIYLSRAWSRKLDIYRENRVMVVLNDLMDINLSIDRFIGSFHKYHQFYRLLEFRKINV